jgi:two-component system, cell cycle response regulator DivK
MSARILIVDDSPINLELACYALKHADYVIEKAVDAEQAEELLKRVTPDLILMDLALPGVDGLTLTRKLKSDERLRSVPIVAFSAVDTNWDQEEALQAGCVGYITKPIEIDQFPKQVAAFLARLTQQ